jgi:hypothetical protein
VRALRVLLGRLRIGVRNVYANFGQPANPALRRIDQRIKKAGCRCLMAALFRLAPAAEEQVGDIVAFIASNSEERPRYGFATRSTPRSGLLAEQSGLGSGESIRISSCTTRQVCRSPSWRCGMAPANS